jgi:hypothetical protein
MIGKTSSGAEKQRQLEQGKKQKGFVSSSFVSPIEAT